MRLGSLHLALPLALLFGCHTHQSLPTTPVAPLAVETDSLDLHFRALAEGMRGEGLAPAGLLQRGFLPPSGRTAFAVTVPAGQCGVFLALATASIADLDAALFTADGDPLVEDDRVSSRPSLTLCAADQPIRADLTLHAYQGAGSFVAAQFQRGARAGDDLHTAFDGQRVSALGQLAQLLHERGFEDAAPRVDLALGDARPVRIAFNVSAGECYTLAAEPSGGLSEVGLRLVDAQGGEVADGVAETELSAVQYCADRRAELAVEVVARRGQGVARIARFRANQAQVGGARALWLVEPSPSSEAWRAKSEAAAPPPRKRPFSSERVRLKQGQVLELDRARSGPSCERWEAQLEPGLSRATLRVENEAGALLGEHDADHLRACVELCAPAGRRRVMLFGRAGFGTVLVTGTSVDKGERAPVGCSVCAVQGACESSGRR